MDFNGLTLVGDGHTLFCAQSALATGDPACVCRLTPTDQNDVTCIKATAHERAHRTWTRDFLFCGDMHTHAEHVLLANLGVRPSWNEGQPLPTDVLEVQLGERLSWND